MSQAGHFFEDFASGQVIRHALGRTVTDADNIWFTGVTHNPNQVHFNADYAAHTPYGKMLVNSCFTLALVTGLTVADLSQTGFNLEWTHVRMPNPLFAGETVYAQSEVLAVRESRRGRSLASSLCAPTVTSKTALLSSSSNATSWSTNVPTPHRATWYRRPTSPASRRAPCVRP